MAKGEAMLDVAEDSTYPRAKYKSHSLIGVFFLNDWFDWIKIRAVFECFDGVTWPALSSLQAAPSDLSGVFLAHSSPQKGFDVWRAPIFKTGRSYLKLRVWLSSRKIATTAIGIWKLGRWTLFHLPYSHPTVALQTVSRPTLHGVSDNKVTGADLD